jgi:hypothetical protein
MVFALTCATFGMSAAAVERRAPPPGWVVVSMGVLDQEENSLCANRSLKEWTTTTAGGGVTLTLLPKASFRPGWRKGWPPKQPAEAEPNFRKAGFDDRQLGGLEVVLKTDDGWIGGFNRGEFGGGLWWVGRAGERRRLALPGDARGLAADNVVAMAAVGPRILVLQGLAHMVTNQGRALSVERDSNGMWRARLLADLGGEPIGMLRSDAGSWFISTNRQLLRLGADGRISVLAIYPSGMASIYPRGLAIDAHGVLWLAARHYAMRGMPGTSGITLELLAPAECPTMHGAAEHCICNR